METCIWTETSIKRFWERNQASFAGDVKAPEIIRQARKYIKGDVLDIGAGSGALIRLLPGAVGVDVVPRDSRILQGSIDSLPFPEKSYDTVFATDVLEHLPSMTLKMGLVEVRRVLRPGGHLIATLPDRENLAQSTVCCPHCQSEFHRWGHVGSFDESMVRGLLKEFKSVRIRSLPLALMAEFWIMRRFWKLISMTGIAKSNELLVIAER